MSVQAFGMAEETSSENTGSRDSGGWGLQPHDTRARITY